MAQCLFGSEPKPGTSAIVLFSETVIAAWLTSNFGPIGAVLAGILATEAINVNDFCSAEPVVPPMPGVADWIDAIASGRPAAAAVVGDYLLKLYQTSIWPAVCQCKASTGGGSCDVDPVTYGALTNQGSPQRQFGCQFHRLNTTTSCYGADVLSSPSGVSKFIKLWRAEVSGPSTLIASKAFTTTGAKQAIFFDTAVPLDTTRAYSVVCTAPESAPTYWAWGLNGGGDFTNIHVEQWNEDSCSDCGFGSLSSTYKRPIFPITCSGGPPPGAPGGTYTPPTPLISPDLPSYTPPSCSTIADLCTQIERLQQKLAQTQMVVNFLQARKAPAAYVIGTPHTGLTGHGSINVTDILGVAVTFTAPSGHGWTADNPRRSIPKVGAIQFGTIDGPQDERQIHYETQLVLDADPLVTTVNYTFTPGVTAEIVELLAQK